MADITKCSTTDCPLAATCYRKTAVSNIYQQAWGNFPVIDGKCTFHMPIETAEWMITDTTPL